MKITGFLCNNWLTAQKIHFWSDSALPPATSNTPSWCWIQDSWPCCIAQRITNYRFPPTPLKFAPDTSFLHQGEGGRVDTNLVRRGAWFSRSEVKRDSHWVHNSVRVLAGLRNIEDSKLSWWKQSSSMFWRLRKSIDFVSFEAQART